MPSPSRLFRTLICATLLLALAGQAHAAVEQPGQNEESWTVNMQGADIRDFIEQISSISGQTFIIDPRVKGQVTVIAQEPMGLAELHKLFLSVMTTHGFAVMPQGDQLRIIPSAEARSSAGSQGNLETRVLQVQHGAANELLPMIRPLVANHGHLAAVPSSNSLIISDAPANIERISDIIRQLDDRSQDNFSVYELKHAWVSELANILGSSLQNAQAAGVQVIADSRSNRLLLLGPREARLRLLKLAQSLDTPSSRSANTRVIRLRHADAKQLAETLGDFGDNLSQSQGSQNSTPLKLMIRADESLNAIVIMAEADVVSLFEDLVRQLDVPRAQVLVEAAIVEMSGDINDALGVQWAIDGRNTGLGGVNFSNTGLSIGTLLGAIASEGSAELAKALPSGAIFGLGNDNFGTLITALSSTGKSNLLSTPTLLTLDNQPAEILVGQNVPFQTGSYSTDASGAGNPFTTIERKDIGVTLKVTPHINDGATLRLEIEQEISSIAPSASLNAQAVDLVTNKRSIKSTILADDGQVIVLGGLIQDDTSTSESKVPVLGDIPVVGRLFRSTREARQKRNLMVFLRPSVARDGVGLANLSLNKYRDLRLLGQASGHNHLPQQARDLFSQDAKPPVTDLRQPQPQPQPAQPPRSLIETPKPVDPASLGDGQGGDVPTPRAHERYTIRLVEGSNQAFMQALLSRHPDQPLRLQQREGGTRYALLYGSYPNRELAVKALALLPEQLPSRTAAAVPESTPGE